MHVLHILAVGGNGAVCAVIDVLLGCVCLQKKGKKRSEGGGEVGGASGGGAGSVNHSSAAPPLTSKSKVPSKNLTQLLQKLSVDEKTKPHHFWDTQPVPRLGENCPSQGVLCPLVDIDL